MVTLPEKMLWVSDFLEKHVDARHDHVFLKNLPIRFHDK